MKTLLLLGVIATAALLFIIGTPVYACPECNIHNYLAGSVRSSTNIFQGEVLSQVDDRTVEVRVLKVLRGTHTVGSKVKSTMYGANEYVGKKFIFSNPTSRPPTFEVLPPEMEEEILFLLRKDPSVDNIKDAVKWVQGVSVETQKIGMDYIQNHHDVAVKPLIVELNALMPQVFSADNVFFGEHRLSQLVTALFLKPTDAGRDFAVSQIEALTKQKLREIDWKVVPRAPSSRGVFLRDILCQTQKLPDVSASVNTTINRIYPKLSGILLAEVNFAMILSGAATPDFLQSKIKDDGISDMLALGLYFAGNYESNWWQHDKAYAFWDKALALAKKKELKDTINKQIRDSEQFAKRTKSNANQPDASGGK